MGTGRVYSDPELLFHRNLRDTEHSQGSSSTKELSRFPGGLEGQFHLERDSSATKMTHLGLDREKNKGKTRENSLWMHTQQRPLCRGKRINYSWKKFH